ncbi:BPSL0067 family protein [Spirosoma sp. HMF3257]|nr:BPSL0067 family protein [Spirosoma telluris]
MAYTCPISIANSHFVGSGECVDLVRQTCGMPGNLSTDVWRAGIQVKGSTGIRPGTAIASFVYGRYPTHGHAAIYLGQDAGGIKVKQQYKHGLHPFVVHEAYIKFGGRGTWLPGDDANYYYVIE